MDGNVLIVFLFLLLTFKSNPSGLTSGKMHRFDILIMLCVALLSSVCGKRKSPGKSGRFINIPQTYLLIKTAAVRAEEENKKGITEENQFINFHF